MQLRDAVDGFIESLKLRTESSETVRGYSNMLNNDFIPYVEERFNGLVYVDEITITDLEDYLRYRKDARGDANVSVNRNLYILRSFYKHMIARDIVIKNLAENIHPLQVKRKERDTLTLEEIDQLLAAIDHDLIRLAIKTLSLTGLRVSELCNIQLTDIDLGKQVIHVIDGKGGKDRKVPISDSLVEDLTVYLEEDRPDVDSENFFALERSGSLSPQYINKVLKETIDKLGWGKEITAHSFRRSFATNLVRKGANVKDVGALLGHEDLRTTSQYLYSNEQELSDAVGLLG